MCCVVCKGSLLTWCVDKATIYCPIRSGTPVLSHVSSCVSKYKNISVGIMLNSRALFWVKNCVFFREPWETDVSHGDLLHGCFNSFTSDVNVLGSALTETWFIISLLNILDPPSFLPLQLSQFTSDRNDQVWQALWLTLLNGICFFSKRSLCTS